MSEVFIDNVYIILYILVTEPITCVKGVRKVNAHIGSESNLNNLSGVEAPETPCYIKMPFQRIQVDTLCACSGWRNIATKKLTC